MDEKKLSLFEGKAVEKWHVNFQDAGVDSQAPFDKIRPFMLPDVNLQGDPATKLFNSNELIC